MKAMDYMPNELLKIEIENKSYDDKLVLQDSTCSFNHFGIYLLTGENGSGKSTLLNILSGNDIDYSGNLIFNGEKITKKNIDKYNFEVSYFTQQNILFDDLTVQKNIFLPYEEKDVNKVDSLLKSLGLEGFGLRPVSELSLGEKQRVSFCRVLYGNKPILLLDEITENLDNDNKQIILKYLDELKKDHLVIFATHDEKVINHFVDKTILVFKDKKVEEISPKKEEANNFHIETSDIKKKEKLLVHKKYLTFNLIFTFLFTCISLIFSSFYTSQNQNRLSDIVYGIYLETAPSYVLRDTTDLEDNKYEKNTIFNIVSSTKLTVDEDSKEYISSILTNSNLSFLQVLEGRLPLNETEIIISNYSYSNYKETDILGKKLSEISNDAYLDKTYYKIVGIYQGVENDYYNRKKDLKIKTNYNYELSYTFEYTSAFTLNDTTSIEGQLLKSSSTNKKLISKSDIYDFSKFINSSSTLPSTPFFLDKNGNYPFSLFSYSYSNLLFCLLNLAFLLVYLSLAIATYINNFKKPYLLLRTIGVRRERIEKTSMVDLIISSTIGFILGLIGAIISLSILNLVYNTIIGSAVNYFMVLNYFYLIFILFQAIFISITLLLINKKLSNKNLSKLINEVKLQ